MKTLILCVDRDDDFGVKADVTSPIIGRKDNLRAAISLGLKDPEDSDTNSLFGAIQLYDQQRDMGEDAEIATLCGNKSVGTKSDRIIGIQLDTVLEMTKPDHVIVVSDGAEDEFIMPLISSRIKIDSVKRVIIRQQKNIEGTLYLITKAIQDEKIGKNILVPISLVFLIYGIFSILNWVIYANGAILIALGLYILIRALHLEEPTLAIGKDIINALRSGKYILAATSLIALATASIGVYLGWYHSLLISNAPSFPLNIVVFFEFGFAYYIAAILVYVFGKTLDTYIRTGLVIRSAVSIILGVISVFFIYSAVTHILTYFIQQYFFGNSIDFNFPNVLINIAFGGFLGFFAIESYYYVKQHFPEETTAPQLH
jgi:putative membrane protein